MNDKYNSAADKIEAIIDQYGHINGEETDRATLLTILREALNKAVRAVQFIDPMSALEMGYGYTKEGQSIIDLLCDALAALDRIEAQKPRVPMAMLEELGYSHLCPYLMNCDREDILREIAARYGVEITEVSE